MPGVPPGKSARKVVLDIPPFLNFTGTVTKELSTMTDRVVSMMLTVKTFSHSISGFLKFPTIVIPSGCSALSSFGRTMVGAGSIGSSGVNFAALLAACSMASISSAHPKWSRGHTTID